jgi:hypothetical protein
VSSCEFSQQGLAVWAWHIGDSSHNTIKAFSVNRVEASRKKSKAASPARIA